MTDAENRCPLCSKLNPPGELACEDCGAQLPAARKELEAKAFTREVTGGVAPVRPVAPMPAARPVSPLSSRPGAPAKFLDNPAWLTPKVSSVFVVLLFLVLMPVSCLLTNNFGTGGSSRAPDSRPVPALPPAPPGYARIRDTAALPPIGTTIYVPSGDSSGAFPVATVVDYQGSHVFPDGTTDSGVLLQVDRDATIWMPLWSFRDYRMVKIGQPAPAADACTGGATAICADGHPSQAAHRQGACSSHGGVARWCN